MYLYILDNVKNFLAINSTMDQFNLEWLKNNEMVQLIFRSLLIVSLDSYVIIKWYVHIKYHVYKNKIN